MILEESKKSPRKETVLIIMATVGLVMAINGIQNLIYRGNDDLSDTQKITGIVNDLHSETINNGKHDYENFYFRLDSLTQTLVINDGCPTYRQVIFNVRTGDTLTVYYKHTPGNAFAYALQIEEGDKVWAKFSDYKKGLFGTSFVGIIIGSGLVIGTIVWYIKKKRNQF